MSALIETLSLSCERDDRLLIDGLNLCVREGEVCQIEGPNGSGKTTLLRILCGLSSHYQGTVLWRKQPVEKVKTQFLSELLYIGHHSGIKAVLSPRENLQWHAATKGISGQTCIDQALEKVGLFGFEDAPCYSLSAGQQRRVGLARLFLRATPLWVLDEPFTAIDKYGVAELEQWIASHAEQGGSVILTTHHELSLPQGHRRVSLA